MLGRFGKDASSLLGVEITSDSLRVAQLRRHRGRYEPLVWAVHEFEPLAPGNRSQGPERLIATLRNACQQSGRRLRRAAVALPASQVICKLCRLPEGQAPSQLEAQLLGDAEQLCPFPLEDLVLDFQVLGDSLLQPGCQDVLVAASRQSSLQPLVAAFEAADLELEVVEVDTIALRRLLPGQGHSGAALLRLEPGSATLHGWLGDTLPVRREWPLETGAGLELLDELADGQMPTELLVAGASAIGQDALLRLSERFGLPCHPLPPVAGVHCQDGCMALAFALALGSLH